MYACNTKKSLYNFSLHHCISQPRKKPFLLPSTPHFIYTFSLFIKDNQNPGEEATSQFLREARILAALRHPNLPRVIDYFVQGQDQYLVMDFVPGETLGEAVLTPLNLLNPNIPLHVQAA
jgi:serine/threonine protein kinase